MASCVPIASSSVPRFLAYSSGEFKDGESFLKLVKEFMCVCGGEAKLYLSHLTYSAGIVKQKDKLIGEKVVFWHMQHISCKRNL